ncbi:DUF262 domain-containing protein [Deinococcus sp.]|uniref:DUF262 domain-containing protein n=1 Tax=Deinococcus sp. TaxID=47478 RepID=UPI003C7A4A25
MTWFGSTEQSVSWFKDRMKEGSLEIKPAYQRKPIWKLEQKCALIESILLDMPIPEIFMQTTTDENGGTNHAIVDGQQRIRTILHFMGLDPTESESEFQNFVLTKLDVSSPYYEKGLSDLNRDEREKFYSYVFTIRTLKTRDEGRIRSVFQRLNKPMLSQELRNAEFSGPFLKLAVQLANLEFWSQSRIITPDKIRRMEDVEFVSELLFGIMLGPQGGSKDVINDLYSTYDSFEEEFPEQVRYSTIFNNTLDLVKKILPDISKTRWSNKSDFYSLFTYLGRRFCDDRHVSDESGFISKLREVGEFISRYQKLEDKSTYSGSMDIVKYVDNVVKGASDKSRRASRYVAMSNLLDTYFTE